MGRKKKVEPDDKEQSARFIETAERVQDEDTKERVKKALEHLLKPSYGGHEQKDHE